MILLDTNVLSETMKVQPDHNVLGWLNAQASETLFISSITIAEILFGIGAMSDGKRKDQLATIAERALALFEDRVLPFDLNAARYYARLAIATRRVGKGFPAPDAYIAAIAAAGDFAVATRDSGAFVAAGLKVINPWAFHS
jgi:predicted nucleic acid-binding protein